jgi:hypothetical protein
VVDVKTIFVFEPFNELLTRITVKELDFPTDIVACKETKQLYVAEGLCGSREPGCVWRVSMDGCQVDMWLPNKPTSALFNPRSLSVTSRRLLVTVFTGRLFLYGPEGDELKCIVPGGGMRDVSHAVETASGMIVVISLKPKPQVCEINLDGCVMRVFSDHQQLSDPCYLSLGSGGRLVFVCDHKNGRVLLFNRYLELQRKLLDRDDVYDYQVVEQPTQVCYMERTGQLVVAGSSNVPVDVGRCATYDFVQVFSVFEI